MGDATGVASYLAPVAGNRSDGAATQMNPVAGGRRKFLRLYFEGGAITMLRAPCEQ